MVLIIIVGIIVVLLIGALIIDISDRRKGRAVRNSGEILQMVRDGRKQARQARRQRGFRGFTDPDDGKKGPYPGADRDGW